MAEKILIVDDDLDTLRLVGLMLQRQNYQVSAASDGSQGLTKAFEEGLRERLKWFEGLASPA